MKEQLQKRLEELRSELVSGGKMLSELDNRRSKLQETLIRIGGAIQVLEEELAKWDAATCGAEIFALQRDQASGEKGPDR